MRKSLIVIAVCAALALAFLTGRASVYRAHLELSLGERAVALLAKVGELIQLPAGETPIIATINDAASAKREQPLLASALNGDMLIIYPNARRNNAAS